jgi:hypothetical protein
MADTPLTNNETITLAHMPQQAHVWRAEDDWTGVIDRKERRKLQNRQNQRKWRMQPSYPFPYSSGAFLPSRYWQAGHSMTN